MNSCSIGVPSEGIEPLWKRATGFLVSGDSDERYALQKPGLEVTLAAAIRPNGTFVGLEGAVHRGVKRGPKR